LVIWFGGNNLGLSDKRIPLGVAGKAIFIALSIASLVGGVVTGPISAA
jgi:hypothetical protein